MAYSTKPTLTMEFLGENKTVSVSFPNVKDTPNATDIKAAGALLSGQFTADDTAEFYQAYYTVDSIVANAED